MRSYAIRLPERPPETIQYGFSQLALSETTRGGNDRPVAIKGGFIQIDSANRRLVIQLELTDGVFWANGEYPLSVLL